MKELPLACTLGPAEMRDRTAEMARIGGEALLAAASHGPRAELRFRPSARADVEAIVAAEAECCAFLAMDLREDDRELVLTINAPPGAEPVLDGLVSAFSAGG
jgi:hypothetical protein